MTNRPGIDPMDAEEELIWGDMEREVEDAAEQAARRAVTRIRELDRRRAARPGPDDVPLTPLGQSESPAG